MTRLDGRSWFARPPGRRSRGRAIALVATYLLWPRDRESAEGVPAPAT